MNKKDLRIGSQILMAGAVLAIIFAGVGYLGTDIWLASTQWLLVSALFALFGLYLKES